MYRRIHWFFKFTLTLLILFFLWLSFSQALPKVLPSRQVANDSLWGIQLQSQSWSGTIRVTGDLIFLPGSTVKIAPGTHIVVSNFDRSNFDFLPWHLKSGLNSGNYYHGVENGEYFWDEQNKIQIHFGSLFALGEKSQPIIWNSSLPSDLATTGDFNVISINSGILSFVQASNYRRLEIGSGVTVRNSQFRKIAECAICIDSGSPSVINNTFDGGEREAIWIDGASPNITDNFFLPDEGAGVEIDPQGLGAPLISHNNFQMPGKLAIDFLTGNEEKGGEISFNNISGSSQLKIPCDSKVNIFDNNIEGALSFQGGGCAQTLIIGPNFWSGEENPQTIQTQRILKTDPKLKVIIEAPLSTLPKSVGPRD